MHGKAFQSGIMGVVKANRKTASDGQEGNTLNDMAFIFEGMETRGGLCTQLREIRIPHLGNRSSRLKRRSRCCQMRRN